jgi:hypothetical protein
LLKQIVGTLQAFALNHCGQGIEPFARFFWISIGRVWRQGLIW